jgi:hypothetical protein
MRLLVIGVILPALFGVAGLWWHYGGLVFFEAIRGGFAACFG